MTAADRRAAVEGPGRATPGTARAANTCSWTLTLTGRRLTANDRPHWTKRADVTREWRTLAWAQAKRAHIPPLERAHILVEWLPPDRRRRDPANAGPMGKAAVDGIVDANVLIDDSSAYLDGPDFRLGPLAAGSLRHAPGLVTLRITITEVAR
jgi:crossover junction endodeoxyribonuclease RusA